MTSVEVKGDIGMATLVHDPNLIQGISPDLDGLPHHAGVLPILLIENSGGIPWIESGSGTVVAIPISHFTSTKVIRGQ